MNFNCREDLITALTYDIKRNKNITFLFGSAISIDGNGVGVPSVKGVINIIQDFISEVGLKEQYESRLSDCDPTSVYQESFDLPLVEGCAGWLICKVIPNAQNEQEHDLFMGEIVGAWSDDRVFRNGHWIFDEAPDELRTVHYVAGGQFYAIGKGTKFNHGPGKD